MMRLPVLISAILLAATAIANAGTAGIPISSDELSRELGARMTRVPEFEYIREEARNLGVHAYLFGGTAAGYAHYVKWDLEREHGDPRYQADRFDYDYTNIFRSNQDLDIVIDGTAEQAGSLQRALEEKFPHLQGSKTAWEVRLLRHAIGDKQAILDNPDFMNQHTDSNSTGMIELTHSGDPIVRDVRDWNSKNPQFLKDVRDGTLHYYFSPLHETTSFYKEGRNPPIISGIRYLTKAFQYESKILPEDLARIQKIIDEFNPKQVAQNGYVGKWIEKNGKKLIQNAVNIEYAVNTLDSLGLRNKLSEIRNNPETADSLAWWMSKEPLRAHPLGAEGKTARELFEENGWAKPGEPLVVAHETNNFLAYESITRAHTGDANVLISREDAVGEQAVHGAGFYTQVGRTGARGTGLTIRFELAPDAKLGTDFTLKSVGKSDYVIVQNKSALRVIPEGIHLNLVEYFQMLANGNEFSSDNKALIEKFKRKVGRAGVISPEDEARLVDMVNHRLEHLNPLVREDPVLREWFSLPVSTNHPELVEKALASGRCDGLLVKSVLSQAIWSRSPRWKAWIDTLIAKKDLHQEIVRYILPREASLAHPEWVTALLETRDLWVASAIAGNVLANPAWMKNPNWLKWFRMVTAMTDPGGMFFSTVLSQVDWRKEPELAKTLMDEALRSRGFSTHVASTLLLPQWRENPSWSTWMSEVVDRWLSPSIVANEVLSQPFSADHPEWIQRMIQAPKGPPILNRYKVLDQPHWKNHPALRTACGGADPTTDCLRAALWRGVRFENPRATCEESFGNLGAGQ